MTDRDVFGPAPGAPPVPRDLETLRAVVAQQRGLVTRAQCLSAGLSDRAIGHRLRTQRWVSVRRGVYLTVPGRTGWWWDATAVLLSVRTGAAWAFETAGFAQGLLRVPPSTVTRSSTPRQHPRLRTAFVCTAAGMRTLGSTSSAGRGGPASTRRSSTCVSRARWTRSRRCSLVRSSAARPRRRRCARCWTGARDILIAALLQDLLDDVASGAESAMEVRFLRDVERAHGLPRGRRQAPLTIGNVRVHDIAYDEKRVLVELDGRLKHDGEDRVRDGIRDRRTATRAWLTVRAFWNDVAGAPCALATEVGEVLNQRSWSDQAHPCRRRGCVASG